MIIKSVELLNFRNYRELAISFDKGTNILFGDNAQGKTNILEAAYMSGTTKSHKGSRDKEMIRFGESEAHIRTIVEKQGKEYRIDMHLRQNRSKGIAVNKIPMKKASELFGILNIVFFSPEDLNIIKNGPAERRRFLDAELCQLDKIYLSDLSDYNKILNQRNKLLKDMIYRPELADTLPIWNQQLVETGKRIVKRRRYFVQELSEIVRDIHYRISGEKEEMRLIYEPSVPEDLFEAELERFDGRDRKLVSTTDMSSTSVTSLVYTDGDGVERRLDIGDSYSDYRATIRVSDFADMFGLDLRIDEDARTLEFSSPDDWDEH